MKLSLDQGLPRRTVQHLLHGGIVAEHVGDLGMATAIDDEIIDEAVERNAVIVTMDSDFHCILAMRAAAGPSVIRLRIEGLKADAIANVLHKVIQSAEEDIRNGAAVSVTASSIRIRKLPLSDTPIADC